MEGPIGSTKFNIPLKNWLLESDLIPEIIVQK